MTGAPVLLSFRRAFVDHEAVCVETEAGVVWTLPNPQPDGRGYRAASVLAAVIQAKAINPDLWKKRS